MQTKLGYFPKSGNSVLYDHDTEEILELTEDGASVVLGCCGHLPTASELPDMGEEFVFDYFGQP